MKRLKWITRERVKVDRVACPWLMMKFIDPQAEFIFVPKEQVEFMIYDAPCAERKRRAKETTR